MAAHDAPAQEGRCTRRLAFVSPPLCAATRPNRSNRRDAYIRIDQQYPHNETNPGIRKPLRSFPSFQDCDSPAKAGFASTRARSAVSLQTWQYHRFAFRAGLSLRVRTIRELAWQWLSAIWLTLRLNDWINRSGLRGRSSY
jgi:hypothetical protein